MNDNWFSTITPVFSDPSHDPSEIILSKKSFFIKTVIHFNIFVETAIYFNPPPGFSDEYKIITIYLKYKSYITLAMSLFSMIKSIYLQNPNLLNSNACKGIITKYSGGPWKQMYRWNKAIVIVHIHLALLFIFNLTPETLAWCLASKRCLVSGSVSPV